MSRFLVERKNCVRVIMRNAVQPALQAIRLSLVATMSNYFDALPQLANGYH